MAGPYVVSMRFQADTGSAKAGLAEVRKALAEVGAEAGKARGSASANAQELDALAAAAAKAARSQADLAAQMRQAHVSVVPAGQQADITAAIAGVTGLGNAMDRLNRGAATAADPTRSAVAGLTASIDGAGAEMMQAAAEARVWRSALDDVRASFNPLFAASRQYEAELERIAEAERLGAISAREAASARERAAARMAPVQQPGVRPGGMSNSPFVTANLAAQGNDIMMMAMAGQNPMQLALQQGTQVSQVLNTLEKGTSVPKVLAAGFMSMVNPVSLVTIGVIGLGAAGIQAFGKLIPKTKSFNEAMEGLASKVEAYAAAQQKARSGDLADQFGRAATAARSLLTEIAALQRTNLGADLAALRDGMDGGSMFGLRDGSARYATLAGMFEEGNAWTRPQASEKTTPLTFAVNRDASLFSHASKTGSLEDQITLAERLRDSFRAAAEASGSVSDEEKKWLLSINQMLLKLREAKAIQDNEAGKARAADLTRALERQTELAGLSARYGAQSAELRAAEARHAREALAVELERAGIRKGDAEWDRAMAAQAASSAAAAAGADHERRAALSDYIRSQDDAIAAVQRQRGLLGATAGEQARMNALAEAEVQIRERNLGVWGGILARVKAVALGAAQAGLADDQAKRDRDHAWEMAGHDLAIGEARDPVSKAALEAQREYARVLYDTKDALKAQDAAALARSRSLAEALGPARQNILALSDELAARQAVAAQIASGTAPAEDATRLLQLELQLRPLIAAATRAEGVEKRKLTAIITGLQLASEALAAEERRGQANDLLRSQAERTAALKVELALIGATAEARARVLGLIEAEQSIRKLQLDASGEAAAQLRREAVEHARLATQIERQSDAWKKVQSAGESAIDGVIDKLTGGDFKGALAEMAGEASKMILELGVKNPLKNRLLGTNLGTMDDLGGWQGILGRLFGGVDEAGIVKAGAAPVSAMTIAATQVTINAASLAGLAGPAANLPFGPAAANSGGAPLGAASPAALSLLQSVAVGGGAREGAIAGLDAALAGPLAAMVTEAQRLFGASAVKVSSAYRSVERQQQLWDAALAKYGSAEVARKWVAPPGRSNHNHGLAADLQYGSPEVSDWFHQNASRFGLGYRLKNEPWHIEPTGARPGTMPVTGAEQTLAQFGTATQAATAQVGLLSAGMTTAGSAAQVAGTQMTSTAPSVAQLGTASQTATAGLGKMGQGLGQFGGQLQGILGAALSGNKGGAASGLLGLGFDLLTKAFEQPAAAPGFAAGGYTGAGARHEVAGVVHAGEYVFDAGATSRIGVGALEAIRRGRLKGYAEGGYVGAAPAIPTATRAPRVPSAETGGRAGGGEGMAMTINVQGARGNAEIMQMVEAGVAEGLRQNNRHLGAQVARVNADKRVRIS